MKRKGDALKSFQWLTSAGGSIITSSKFPLQRSPDLAYISPKRGKVTVVAIIFVKKLRLPKLFCSVLDGGGAIANFL